jgi:Inner membrane component of T3SS, cytoplasmic domain
MSRATLPGPISPSAEPKSPLPPAAAPIARSGRANLRQAYDLAIMGGLGALIGLYLYVEMVQAESVYVRDAWAGLLIGGSLGAFLNAYGPARDGAWLKMARAITWGAPAAALGGALGLLAGEVVIGVLRGGLLGRALSWAVLGLGIGLGQGLADRSRERLKYGLIGGGLGGFAGGFLFEWLRSTFGDRTDVSQAFGIVLLGAGLGLCLALVEQVLRRAWVQVQSGRQEGRIYLLAHPRCRLGLDERAEIGIFGDPAVARRHAEIESTARGYVLHHLAGQGTTRVNGGSVAAERLLQDGDRIELGHTLLVFRQR